MQKLYWRPRYVSRVQLALVAGVALGSLLLVESLPVETQRPHFREKVAAPRLAKDAMDAVKAERLRRKLPWDPETDPAQTGIGFISDTFISKTATLRDRR